MPRPPYTTPSASASAPCSAGWFLAGWQRKWTRTTGNDWYVARVFSRLLDADVRYQRKNQMGKYSLPNETSAATGSGRSENE